MYLDSTVYPDLDPPPQTLDRVYDRADYLHRICTAWDFGLHPEPQTFALLSTWREIFDQFPILTSPAYHAFRAWYRWNALSYPFGLPAPVPSWVHLDRLEGRPPDPCEQLI